MAVDNVQIKYNISNAPWPLNFVMILQYYENYFANFKIFSGVSRFLSKYFRCSSFMLLHQW